jgi:hypothetical protein
MKAKILQGLAIFFMIEIGFVHFLSSQHEFEEAWILGYLFIFNFLGALVAAYGIYRRKTWGWGLGFLIAAGSLVAYVWSRTSGLPGLQPEEWISPWGVTSLITEGAFCLLALLQAWWMRQPVIELVQLTGTWRYLVPVVALMVLVPFNYSVYQVDANFPEYDHSHVFFLWQVRLQPQISAQTLEEKYGMRISLVARTAMNGIVDVRLKVLDPEKAGPLLDDGHFAILVGDKLIASPHVARHMLVNKTIIVMFPNQQRVVQNGTPVSFVFENLSVDPVAAR